MHWILLAIGVCIEVAASASLMLSDGFTKIEYALLTLACFGQAPDGYAHLGIGLTLAGVVVLNARSTAASSS